MHTALAARLMVAEAEYQAAQAQHDGSPSSCARYRAALAELEAAERAASQALRDDVESRCPSER